MAILSLALLLAGCSHQQLDWDNARVDGGKIYKDKEDTPFTGDVTNIPDTLVVTQSSKLVNLGTFGQTVTTGIPGAFNVNSVTNMVFNDGTCDGYAKDGYLDGKATCTNNGTAYLVLHFKDGQVVGEYRWGGSKDSSKKHFLLEGSFDDHGAFDGTQTFYRSNDAKWLVINYSHGKQVGDQDLYTEDNVLTEHIHFDDNGLRDGVQEEHSASGELIVHSEFAHGKRNGELKQFSVTLDPTGKLIVGNIMIDSVYQDGKLVEDKLQH